MTGPSESSRASRLGPGLILLWAGLTLGVAFLATPAKFLAPSLSLTVALDVGRQTFHLYNRVEIGLLLGLAGFGVIWTPTRCLGGSVQALGNALQHSGHSVQDPLAVAVVAQQIEIEPARQQHFFDQHVEFANVALDLGLVGLGAISTPPRGWRLALAVPAGVILTQSLWLLPRLDARVAAIIAGAVPPPSPLHVIYIAAEGLKTLWLLAFGLGGLSPQTEGASWLRAATLPDLTPAHTKD